MLGLVVVVAVVVHQHADHARQRPGHGDLARAQQRHPIEPQPPCGDGGKLGVEIVGQREDAAHHHVGRQRVARHQLAHQKICCIEDRARVVGLDAIGAPEREQPHRAQFCQRAPGFSPPRPPAPRGAGVVIALANGPCAVPA